jgi:hypothetical protein
VRTVLHDCILPGEGDRQAGEDDCIRGEIGS